MEGKLVCVVPLSQKHATGNTTLKIVPIGALARNFRPLRALDDAPNSRRDMQ
jgi:hypothetical protein